MDKQKRALEKKQRNKKRRDDKKKELQMQKIEYKQSKNKESSILKKHQKAEVQVLAYMYNAVYGKMPEEGESMDAIAIRDLCKKILTKKYYIADDRIFGYAERKIKIINQTLKKENLVVKNLKKLFKK